MKQLMLSVLALSPTLYCGTLVRLATMNSTRFAAVPPLTLIGWSYLLTLNHNPCFQDDEDDEDDEDDDEDDQDEDDEEEEEPKKKGGKGGKGKPAAGFAAPSSGTGGEQPECKQN